MNSSFEMAGYFDENINLSALKIAALNLNDHDNILSLKVSVDLEFDDVKDN